LATAIVFQKKELPVRQCGTAIAETITSGIVAAFFCCSCLVVIAIENQDEYNPNI
jgi:formamidopyrimidine-DNA glycosylase